ncbi:alpha/beta fold hydrolase [Nocardia sp. CDC160]|uniref:alpha/beta fold hydrolase n=1 Tax=Nocardia sp. CDC160 TaxID=3112166 RepID=UPI002DB6694D|nr:alpha/beta fold hydrolase [Nocardia sp. CDC160]MEC3917896.1 alpha/beta fold hydrolase [Nocardia sp. CDC160]
MSESSTGTAVARSIEVHGITLRYHEFGSGRPLIWLHGGGPGASGMTSYGRTLGAFEDHRNLVFDLPGFGESDKPRSTDPLIDSGARQLAAALRALGCERARLIGNSLGGGIAAKIAIDEPNLVDALVLLGSAGVVPPGERALPEGLALLLRDLIEGSTPADVERFVRAAVYDSAWDRSELVEQRYLASLEPGVRAAAGVPPIVDRLVRLGVPIGALLSAGPVQRLALRLLVARLGDLSGELGRVRARTLLLWGREDRFVPLEWGLALERGIPDAMLTVRPHCGHWPHLEHPEWFTATVREFLGDQERAA